MEKTHNKTTVITIIGMGYIGLPTATMFASAGFKVYGYDVNESVINTLRKGEIHIVEPELKELFKNVLESDHLVPTTEIHESDVYIICVPTPFKEDRNEKLVDLSFVEEASKAVAKVLKKGDLVILESTVPPETTDICMNNILEKGSGLKVNEDYSIAHCPERVLPGQILEELRNNDRIIGVSDEKAGLLAKELYSQIVTKGNIYITNSVTAEMCKLVENTFRDINIAFANELSMICDKLNINVWELIQLANKHPRVNILKPGAGVGGHCLAVDPWFIVEKFPGLSKVIRASREVNDYKPEWVVEKAEKEIKRHFDRKNITIGILGLAYKPNIDDLRESPSMKIALALKEKGYNLIACEPHCSKSVINGLENKVFDDVVEKSDYIIYCVPHAQFESEKGKLKNKTILDVVGQFE